MLEVTREGLEIVVSLQEKDKELDVRRARLQAIPGEMDEVRQRLDDEKARIEDIKKKTVELQVSRKGEEVDLASKEEDIRKHQEELNKVKTNEAFRALLSEIETAKAEKSQLEDDVLLIMEQQDQLAREGKEAKQRLGQMEAEAQAALRELEAKKTSLESEIGSKQSERDDRSSRIEPEVLAQYEYVRERKRGLAVVPVTGDGCGGCHMRLTPQHFVELRKGNRLVTCDGCQRILYLP